MLDYLFNGERRERFGYRLETDLHHSAPIISYYYKYYIIYIYTYIYILYYIIYVYPSLHIKWPTATRNPTTPTAPWQVGATSATSEHGQLLRQAKEVIASLDTCGDPTVMERWMHHLEESVHPMKEAWANYWQFAMAPGEVVVGQNPGTQTVN